MSQAKGVMHGQNEQEQASYYMAKLKTHKLWVSFVSSPFLRQEQMGVCRILAHTGAVLSTPPPTAISSTLAKWLRFSPRENTINHPHWCHWHFKRWPNKWCTSSLTSLGTSSAYTRAWGTHQQHLGESLWAELETSEGVGGLFLGHSLTAVTCHQFCFPHPRTQGPWDELQWHIPVYTSFRAICWGTTHVPPPPSQIHRTAGVGYNWNPKCSTAMAVVHRPPRKERPYPEKTCIFGKNQSSSHHFKLKETLVSLPN